MENAGRAVAVAAARVAGGTYGRRAIVVCGKGNNGGDGLVAARLLARRGMLVTVALLSDPSVAADPVAGKLASLTAQEWVRIGPANPEGSLPELARADIAVDAIFGTGFRGVPGGDHASAIRALNEARAAVVAVDVPSGVDAGTGAVAGDAVWANATVALGCLKPGLLLRPGSARAGSVEVADIGVPPDLIRGDIHVVETQDVGALMPVRPADAHKRSSGVVLVIGGSRLMPGAVRLMARAAYRAGAGLVTAAVPEGILRLAQGDLSEATFLSLPETDGGSIAGAALSALRGKLEGFDAVAVGPGLTTDDSTQRFVRELVRMSPVPLVVDADGLNAFEGRAAEIADHAAEVVLTPHAGELARLAGISPGDLSQDRLGHARKLARETRAVVLLKGSPTLVVSPDGDARLVTSGVPALATAGSGDVLTGAITAFLARGLATADAATAGAHLHGLAGRLAGQRLGEGATAVDVLESLAAAALEVHRP
jgi:NAD(P)H-hydrate epimerase